MKIKFTTTHANSRFLVELFSVRYFAVNVVGRTRILKFSRFSRFHVDTEAEEIFQRFYVDSTKHDVIE